MHKTCASNFLFLLVNNLHGAVAVAGSNRKINFVLICRIAFHERFIAITIKNLIKTVSDKTGPELEESSLFKNI